MTTEGPHDEFRVAKGDVIFRQGDEGHEMYVISEGRVRLTIGSGGHEKEINVLGAGEFFGELSLLSDAPRSATAMAAEDTVLLRIGRDVFTMLVQDDLDIVFRMFDIQGRRLSQTNLPLQELSQRLARVRIAARALRHVLVGGSQLPATLNVDRLVTEAGGSAEVVRDTLSDLAARGIGALTDGEWKIDNREQIDRLLDALCRYATPE
jgi:CRP/FNR family cyclic AMP-dependent transcriptional regulator